MGGFGGFGGWVYVGCLVLNGFEVVHGVGLVTRCLFLGIFARSFGDAFGEVSPL